MIKIINTFFALLSLLVIVALVYVFNDALETVSLLFGESATIPLLKAVIAEGTTDEIMRVIAALGTAIFLLFGFPVTVFLVSINGLKE